MNRLYLIIIMALAICISCKGNRNASVTKEIMQDSIIGTNVENPFGYLEKLGLEYESLIANGDTLLTQGDNDCLLSTKEQRTLVDGVINSVYSAVDTFPSYLVSVRQITDDIISCQFKYLKSSTEHTYFATYNIKGELIDAMYGGTNWGKTYFKRELSDSTELMWAWGSQMRFIGEHEFTLTREYKEIEHDINICQDSTTYFKLASLTYNIGSDGKIVVFIPEADVYEEGVSRRWSDPGFKSEEDLMDEIFILTLYPYSDEKVLEQWINLGKRVDGLPSEEFGWRFLQYVFIPNSKKVLKWIYDNRDANPETLTSHIEFEYTNEPRIREIILAEIEKLDDQAMRSFFKEMTSSWNNELQY